MSAVLVSPSTATTTDESAPAFGRGPEWPLAALLVLYPVWWALGLSVLIFQILAVPMLVHLLRRWRTVRTPPGFGFWLAFLAWAALSLVMVWYTPPGTVAEPTAEKFIIAAFRFSQYMALGVMLLFIGNLPRSRLSGGRIGYLLGLVYCFGIVGGLLALAAPSLEFTSAVEFLLPGALADNAWINSMVHPSLAQVHEIIGEPIGRPAAPFGYTNMWGAVLAMLLPWLVATWILPASGRRRVVGISILVLSIPPVVFSLNRGLWIALALMLLIAAGRELLAGRLAAMMLIIAGAVAAIVLLVFSPLGSVVQERIDSPHSNQIREMTTQKALELSSYSPALGYGTTRDMVGSHRSIVIGQTPECPRCGNVPIGQNGQFWMVLVSQGWVGIVLFYGMFVTVLLRWRKLGGPLVAAGMLSLIVSLAMSLYYDMMLIPLAFMVLSLGALWVSAREADEGESPPVAAALSR